MPRPTTGPFANAPHKMPWVEKPLPPKTSWWASGASREAFSATAKQEARRMAGSQGERLVSQIHAGRQAELGKPGLK